MTPDSAKASFSIWRVLLAVVLVGGPGAAIWWSLETKEPTPPPLYPVRGVAYLDGEPMTDGVVMTFYTADRKLLGGLSAIDENGRFELNTNGRPGVYGGEHKVTVLLTSGGFPPVSLIPEKYSSKEDTPFRIVVVAATQNKPVKLELFGRKPAPARPQGGYSRRIPGQAGEGPSSARGSRPRSGSRSPGQAGDEPDAGQDSGGESADGAPRNRDAAIPGRDSEKVN